MKEYLENRIKELREADAKFCADRWDMDKHQLIRAMARENSNSVTLARQELERTLDVFNKLYIGSVSKRYVMELEIDEKYVCHIETSDKDKIGVYAFDSNKKRVQCYLGTIKDGGFDHDRYKNNTY